MWPLCIVCHPIQGSCRIHIKYVDNMDLKTKNDYLDGNISKSYAVLIKMTLKMDFGCESYAPLKKGIDGNQMAT
jgi:hypothetical protein